MKVLDILNPFNILKEEEVLEEAKLSSEFKIGFELEGVCDSTVPGLEDIGYLPSYHSANEPGGGSKVLLDLLNDRLGLGKGKIEKDGSVYVRHNDTTGHAWPFEYGSPIIPFNPTNINKITKFLLGLKEIGVYTNETCGFHTHISFKDISRNDVKWILFCIANDDELLQEVSELQVEGEEPIEFFGGYATDEWFRDLKVSGSLEDWEFSRDTSTKYLIMRMHPDAGTIEWRGPRNFINDGSNAALIKGYIKKLYKLVLTIGKIVELKEYNGFKKSEVLEKMNITGKFNSPYEISSIKSAQELEKIVFKKPIVLITLQPSKLEKMLDESPKIIRMSYYDSNVRQELVNIWDKIPMKNKALLIKTMSNDSEFEWLDTILSKIENKKFDTAISKLITSGTSSFFIGHYLNNLTFESSESLNKLLKKNWLTNDQKIMLMIGNQHLLDIQSYKTIIDSKNFYLIRKFKNLPVKIQRILIRRSPYNIQYINNPDQSIIDELKKKYGEEVEEYILGEL